jgi:quinol monooxygenase YgiN
MPVIVVTRLRLKDHSWEEEFYDAALAVMEQVNDSEGSLGSDALADENDVWWTLTAWQDLDSVQAFMSTEPFRSTMEMVDEWCDEATFVHWEQRSLDLPDWQTSFNRLVADGQAASLTHASEAHATRAFPAPVEVP